ncbi:MAG TPA: outer membrane beta-barrel protein [Candidatus Bathyarchaeia archaeon]
MKKILLLSTLLVTPAIGADLYTKAPPAPLGYGDPWNGFYVGINGGYGFERGAGSGQTTNFLHNIGTDFATSPQGFVGGLHVGYMWHLPGSGFVFGVEGDGDIATLDGTQQNPGFIGNVNSKNRWLASFRGRLGYILVPNVLAYGTGGYGWGSADFTVTGTDGSQVNFKPTLGGAVLGGGIEIALTPSLLARVEYLHYFLNDINGSFSGKLMPIGVSANMIFHADDNVSLIRGGLSYKF